MTETASDRPAHALAAERLAARCLDALRADGRTVATAESLTAGLVSSTFAAVPGASDALRGGLVAYASDVKTAVLGVPEAVVTSYGVVSAECAGAMATGVRRLFDADWGVATTGVAGPDPQEGKPVGTVFVAVVGPAGADHRALTLNGSRQQIRTATVLEALALLLTLLSGDADARTGWR